ncbi:MAG: hypothetical protein OXU75_05020 [Deltaproteobacteria bacterium]|nr:hypothetical protein [Deltaproteobacteria bacterium]
MHALDDGPERFGLTVQRPHGLGVAGILALLAGFVRLGERGHDLAVTPVLTFLALVPSPTHLPNAVPYERNTGGRDCELSYCDPFPWRHVVALFLSFDTDKAKRQPLKVYRNRQDLDIARVFQQRDMTLKEEVESCLKPEQRGLCITEVV